MAPVTQFPHQIWIDINLLEGHKKNYNQHPKSQIDGLIADLKRFGQQKPIVIQNKNGTPTIIAGHGLVLAFKELAKHNVKEWGIIWAKVVPEEWSDEDVEGYMAADNETGRLAEPDNAGLLAILDSQRASGYDLLTLGFTQAAYQELVASVNAVPMFEAPPVAPVVIYSPDAIEQAAFLHFRQGGFPYRKLPLYLCLQEINQLANVEIEKLLNSTYGYAVADTYHPHRFAAPVSGMRTPLSAFADDTLLQHTLHLFQELTGSIPANILSLLSLVRGTQVCSNFRPAFALYLYKKYCQPGAVVLDTSTGYGGRLVGYIASGLAGTYIGIDPNTQTHRANQAMAHDLLFDQHIELFNLPAEDVHPMTVANRCDFAFTSPPYFSKEQYSDEETQSWKRYRTGEDWRDGFLAKMLALQFVALKQGCYAVVNIADVTIKNRRYPLVEWAIEMAKQAGFDYITTEEYSLKHRLGAGHEEDVVTEPVLVFQKPASTTPVVVEAVPATRPVKVSAAFARLLFHPCAPDYISQVCHGRCCERGGVAVLIAVTPRETIAVEKLGATVKDGMIQAKAFDHKCYFKTTTHLCALHHTPEKPLGCIASPFTLHKSGDTLIVRYRYTSLVCHNEDRMGGSLPAYQAHRGSLDAIFGAQESARICTHFDNGGGDIIAQMPLEVYQTLRNNDQQRKAVVQ